MGGGGIDPPGLFISVFEFNVFTVCAIFLLSLFWPVALALLLMFSTISFTRPGGPICGGGGGGITILSSWSMGWLSGGAGRGSNALGGLCGLGGDGVGGALSLHSSVVGR